MSANRYEFKKALKSHQDLRRQKKKDPDTEESIIEFLGEKFSHAQYLTELLDLATPNEIGRSIQMISEDESIKAYGLENLVRYAGESVSNLEGRMDVETAAHVIETTNQINTETNLLTLDAIGRQLTGGFIAIDRMKTLLKSSVAAVAAAAYWVKAYQRKNSFEYWLKRELVKRGMLQRELGLLDKMQAKTEPPSHFSSWQEIEKNILKGDTFENISYRKYKILLEAKLEKLFSLRDREQNKLAEHEKDWLEQNQAISLKDVNDILVNLQKMHANRKLEVIEQRVETRVLAELKYEYDDNYHYTVHMDAGVARVLDEYVEDRNSDSRRKSFVNQMNEFKNNKISEKTLDKMDKAKEANIALKAQLSKKEEERRKDFIAKTLVLASCVLAFALFITALSLPGAQPVLIASGVVLLAGLVGAHFIKPGVLTDLKNDFSEFFSRMGREFNYSSHKEKVKTSVKQKNSLNAVIEETIEEARNNNLLPGSQQYNEHVLTELKQVLIADYTKIKNLLDKPPHRVRHSSFFRNEEIRKQHKIDELLLDLQALKEDDFNRLHEVARQIKTFYQGRELPYDKQIADTMINIVATAKRIDDISGPHESEKPGL